MLGRPLATVFGSPLKRAKDREGDRPRKARRLEATPPLLLTKPETKKVPDVVGAKAEEVTLKRKTHITPTPKPDAE